MSCLKIGEYSPIVTGTYCARANIFDELWAVTLSEILKHAPKKYKNLFVWKGKQSKASVYHFT